MRRIDKQTVLDAYNTCGLKPIQGITKLDNSCCLVGALVLAKSPEQSKFVLNDVANSLGYTTSYVAGLVDGFDGEIRTRLFIDKAEYALGIQDGQMAWEVVRDAV